MFLSRDAAPEERAEGRKGGRKHRRSKHRNRRHFSFFPSGATSFVLHYNQRPNYETYLSFLDCNGRRSAQLPRFDTLEPRSRRVPFEGASEQTGCRCVDFHGGKRRGWEGRKPQFTRTSRDFNRNAVDFARLSMSTSARGKLTAPPAPKTDLAVYFQQRGWPGQIASERMGIPCLGNEGCI